MEYRVKKKFDLRPMLNVFWIPGETVSDIVIDKVFSQNIKECFILDGIIKPIQETPEPMTIEVEEVKPEKQIKGKNLIIFDNGYATDGKRLFFVGECLGSTLDISFRINDLRERMEDIGTLNATIGNIKMIEVPMNSIEFINYKKIKDKYKELTKIKT